ncbi:MAG: bifunctional serine/threonine-protein kinase/formylglycine-generating enzyme family protein [Polyangiaceae bacterium]
MADALSPGDLVAGKYRIEHKLGEGGMGVVFSATHLSLEQRRAIKVLRADVAVSAEAVQRFLREARAVSTLESRHVVRVHDVDRLPTGEPYFVMEQLDGADLASVLAEHGPLPAGESAGYVRQACDALAEAHQRGLVHRDIKPANLFLAKREDGPPILKVLDFGIAKAIEPAPGPKTVTGAFLGTLQYGAPEQIECSAAVDARADVWALGVVLYELVTGAPPFESRSMTRLIALVTESSPAPPSTHIEGLPAGFDEVVLRCLEKDRERRYASARELGEALLPFADEAAPPPERLVITAATRASQETMSLLARPLAPAPTRPVAPSPAAPIAPSPAAPRTLARRRTALLGVAAVALAAVPIFVALGRRSPRDERAEQAPSPVVSSRPEIPSCVGARRCDGLQPQVCDANGAWQNEGPACSAPPGAAAACSEGRCRFASCQSSGAGLSDCGPNGESCCASPLVPGGTFNRSNDPAAPAIVSGFRLDRYEISVGRFRKFVEGYPANRPLPGAGAHPAVPGSGWASAWDENLPADQKALRARLHCFSYPVWTDTAGANEALPINCINWWEAFAFCAWDGGRLPTEAEWSYAASGGREQRPYPWGRAAPRRDLALFNCQGDEAAACGVADILKVGSRSPAGDGKFGHADLAGSMYEWVLDSMPVLTPDWRAHYLLPCADCLADGTGPTKGIRGGGWLWGASDLATSFRNSSGPNTHDGALGARCARDP